MSPVFIHTADWQLGKPFSWIEEEAKRSLLQNQRLESLRRTASLVKEHKASFVIVAGDLFDSSRPTKSVVSSACSVIGAMEVPVYVIPGNHDHAGPGCLWEQDFFLRESRQLSRNLHLLTTQAPLVTDFATLFPAPLLRRHESSDPTAWIRNLPDFASLPTDRPRIVIAHGSVHGFSSSQDEDDGGDIANRIDLEQLPFTELDYIALGDWHGTKEIQPNAWYSGTPEPDRFQKGDSHRLGNILKVTAERGQRAIVEPLPTAGVGWHRHAFSFSEDSDLEVLTSHIDAILGQRVGSDILHLELDGFLSITASIRLEKLIEAWEARLLQVRLSNRVLVTPSSDELSALIDRPDDPLIARVARQLIDESAGDSEEASIARIALRELHAACLP